MKQAISTRSKNLQTVATQQPRPTLRALVLGLALAGYGAEAFAATNSYTMTDLSAGGDPYYFRPIDVTDTGKIFASYPSDPLGPVFNIPRILDPITGQITDIRVTAGGGLLGGNYAGVSNGQIAINTNGQIVAGAQLIGQLGKGNIFVINPDGTTIDLGQFPTYNPTSFVQFDGAVPAAINKNGQVVINSTLHNSSDPANVLYFSSSFIASTNGGGYQSIGSLSAGSAMTTDSILSYDINASGQVVGTSHLVYQAGVQQAATHAFVSTPTGLKDLNLTSGMPINLAQSQQVSGAYAINDAGLAVGEYTSYMQQVCSARGGCANFPFLRPVIWDTTKNTYTLTDLPTNMAGSLLDINASGQVVGKVAPTTNASPFGLGFVGSASGAMTDLNTLVTGLPTGWTITSAKKINDAGQILADVVAFNAVTVSSVGKNVLLTPSTNPVALPTAPSGLTTTTTSSSQINLTWADNANNESAQYVERCAGAGCSNFVQVASLAANVTSYNDTGLTAATSYSYRVRAHGATGDSAYSNIATVSTAAVTNVAPAAPSNLVSSAKTRNQVVLTWVDNASNELNYLIERCKGATCTNFIQVASVGTNVVTYSNTGLSRNTSYNYRVRAANATGKSAYSNTLNVKTLP
jgi:hypothetical protein